jgi:asparagine synthase (glutamine-hydrolysing)
VTLFNGVFRSERAPVLDISEPVWPSSTKRWSSGPISFHWSGSKTDAGGFFRDAESGFAVVGDVRIDNRAELAGQLALELRSTSDEALVLAAYGRWGIDCPLRLIGDFAFGIWDPTLQQIFFARDHFGIKPLYYASSPGRFVFGSDARGLTLGEVRVVKARRIAEFILGQPPAAGEGFQVGVYRLPPGTSALATASDVSVRRYYRLEPAQVRLKAPEEAFREVFTEAVRCRLSANGGEAAMLSGGLDSSSIAAIAALIGRGKSQGDLPTISRVFDETPQWNERPFIEAVVAQGGLAPIYLAADEPDPFWEIDQVILEQDGLFLAPGLTLGRAVYRAASERGLNIILDGHGGDEVVSHGWGRLSELAVAGRWLELWRQCKGVSSAYNDSPKQLFVSALMNHTVARMGIRGARRIRRGFRANAPQTGFSRFLGADLRRQIEIDYRRPRSEQRPEPGEQAAHWRLLTDELQPYALEVLHLNATALGVEARYPFWDKRLVELCLGLAPEQKLDEGWSRLILRRAMEGVLPAAVQWRRDKLDFAPHLIRGMLKHSLPLLNDIIFGDEEEIGRFMDLAELRLAYERVKRLKEEASGLDVQAIWRAVVLSRWLAQTQDIISA